MLVRRVSQGLAAEHKNASKEAIHMSMSLSSSIKHPCITPSNGSSENDLYTFRRHRIWSRLSKQCVNHTNGKQCLHWSNGTSWLCVHKIALFFGLVFHYVQAINIILSSGWSVFQINLFWVHIFLFWYIQNQLWLFVLPVTSNSFYHSLSMTTTISRNQLGLKHGYLTKSLVSCKI